MSDQNNNEVNTWTTTVPVRPPTPPRMLNPTSGKDGFGILEPPRRLEKTVVPIVDSPPPPPPKK
jgi:hypothetical protein